MSTQTTTRLYAKTGYGFSKLEPNEVLVASENPRIAFDFNETGYDEGNPDCGELRLLDVAAQNPADWDDLKEVCNDLGIHLVDIGNIATDNSEPNQVLLKPEVRAALEAKGFDSWHGHITLHNLQPKVTLLWKPETFSIIQDPKDAFHFDFDRDDNGNLRLQVLTTEGRDLLIRWEHKYGGDDHLLGEMLEHTGWQGNGQLFLVAPEDIGALTDAPILSDDVTVNDEGDTEVHGNVFWFPNYAVRNFADDMLMNGHATFTWAKPEPEPAPKI